MVQRWRQRLRCRRISRTSWPASTRAATASAPPRKPYYLLDGPRCLAERATVLALQRTDPSAVHYHRERSTVWHVTQDHTTAASVCYRHPKRATLLSCSRCGRPICASCSIDAAVGQRCPVCVREEGVQKVIPTTSGRRPAGDAPVTKGVHLPGYRLLSHVRVLQPPESHLPEPGSGELSGCRG